jgi:hypothetical protein
LVQESGKHGGEAAGPVVRDIIKTYYDKKAKKTQGQFTVDYKRYDFGSDPVHTAAGHSPAVLKPEVKETAAVAPSHASAARER